MTYTATGLPAGLTLDVNTGEITGIVDNSASQNGPASDGVYTVVVTADDGLGENVSTSFTWTVANPGPTATHNTGLVSEDGTLSDAGNVISDEDGFGIDSDVDADDLSISQFAGSAANVGVGTSGTYGTIVLSNDGSYVYTLDNNNADVDALDIGETLNESFTYTVTDNEGGTSQATLSITINGANDAPIAGATIPSQSNDDADPITLVDVTSAFSDPDGDTLTYKATGLPTGLTLDLNSGEITGTIDHSASTGGPFGDGVYAVEVTATDDNGETVTTTFTWTVANPGPTATDNTGLVSEDTILTQIGNLISDDDGFGIDSDPDLDNLTVGEVNSEAGSVGVVVSGNYGQIQIDNSGEYTYTLDNNNAAVQALDDGETLTESFTYTVTDNEGGASTATLSITVNGTNDSPKVGGTLPNQSDNDADTISTIDVTGVFSDVDDTLTYTAAGLPDGLTLDLNSGEITGSIDNSASQGGPLGNGVYTVKVTATDDNNESVSTEFTWTVANPGPDAADDSDSTNQISTTDGNVITNLAGLDTDTDGDTLTVDEVSGMQTFVGTTVIGSNGGQFTINVDGSYSFDPNGDFESVGNGEMATTSVTYTITDSEGGTDIATLEITVFGQNDDPTQVDSIPAQANEDADAITSVDTSVYFEDVDANDTLTFTVSGLPTGLEIDSATGEITGTIDNSASVGGLLSDGVYEVTVTADDGKGGTVDQTFNWTVTNPGPIAVDDSNTTDEETNIGGDVIGGSDSDPDGDLITVNEVDGLASNVGAAVAGSNGGLFTINDDGSFSFSPNSAFEDLAVGETRDTEITYSITDSEGGFATATLSVTVTGVNDAPVVGGTIPPQADADADTISALNVSGVFSDPDSSDVLTYTATGLPSGLTLDLNTGEITGTIDNSASQGGPLADGVYSVEVTATDTNGLSVSTTFAWTTTNPGPTATDNSSEIAEDLIATSGDVILDDNGTGADSDPDGDDLSVSSFDGLAANVGVSVTGEYGDIVLNNDGTYTYAVDNSNAAVDALDDGEQLTETFTYTVTDSEGGTSQANLTITINGTNDAPVVGGTIPAQASDDADMIVPVDVTTAFSDVEGDTLTYTAAGLPTGLTLDPNTGEISGTIDNSASQAGPNSDGVYTVEVTATDDSSATVTASFEWTVTNPGPTALDNFAAVTEDINLTDAGNVIADDDGVGADFDPDGDSIYVSSFVGTPANIGVDVTGNYGTIVLQSDGEYVYTLDNSNPAVNALDDGETLSETFFYSIRDGEGGGHFARLIIEINGSNDAPVTGGTIPSQANLDAEAIVPLDAASVFSDPDGDTLTYSATGLPTGLTIDTVTGEITGTIDNSASQEGPLNDGVFVVEVTATDDNGESITTTFSWGVTNPSVVATDNQSEVTEDIDLVTNGNVIADDDGAGVDSDADNDDITVSQLNASDANVGVTVAGDYGDIVLNSDGTYTYSLDNSNPDVANIANGATLTDNFTYTITDNEGGTSTANIAIVINSNNDAPTSNQIPSQTDLDSETPSLNVTPFFNDIDGSILTFNASGLPTGLSIDPLSGEITGTVDSSASQGGPSSDGIYTVEVIATDEFGSTVASTLTWTIDNPGPIANTDSFTTDEDTTLTGTVATNDSDPDGDTVAFAVTGTGPASGDVTLNPDGTFSYTPGENFNGTDSFDYAVTDSDGATATTTVTITVNAINDVPVVDSPTPDQTSEDSDQVNVDISANFSDTESSLTFDATGLPPGLSIDANGNITGTIVPSASQDGPSSDGVYTVVITATDALGATVTDTLTWTVTNPGPIAGNDTFDIDEDNPLNASVVAGDSDPDGDAVSFNLLTNGPNSGIISFNSDGTFEYVPDANFFGTDTFDYEIVDADGSTAVATVTINVGGVNDAPVVQTPTPDQNSNDSETVSIDASVGFSDIDADTLTFSSNGLPDGLTIDPTTGIISGTIDSSASQGGPFGDGIYTVVVTADDGNGGTVTDTFTYTVLNIAPTPIDDEFSTSEDTAVDGNVATNDSDLDGDAITFSAVTEPSNGALIWNTDGTFTYTPDAEFSGTDSFTYQTTDADGATETAEVTINVAAVNDAPIAENDNTTVAEDNPVTINVLDNDNDPETETLSVTIVAQPVNGTVTVNPDGSVTYQPNGDFNGTDTFEYEICDPSGACDTAVVTVLVTPVDDVPVANDDEFFTNEDTPVMGSVANNDVEPDGDSLTFNLTSPPAEGTISFNDDGTFTYIPPENFNGPVTFEYEACDSNGQCDVATATINVVSVNDGPLAVDDAATTDEDTTVTVDLLANDLDIEEDTLAVIEINGVSILPGETMSLPSGAKVTLQLNGTATYDPNGQYEDLLSGQSAIDTFLYTITDGNGGTSIAETVIMINGENDIPVANDDFIRSPLNTPVTINVLGNDYDAEDQPLAVVLLNQPVNGTAVVNPDGSIEFTPELDFEGTVTLHYLVEDPNGSTDDATVTIEVEPPFQFDSFTDFSKTNDILRGVDHRPDITREVISQKIFTLAPEPIFSGYAAPGTQIIGRIYDSSGSLVGEASANTDPGGNWMMQFHDAKGHDFYRIEFQQVASGASDVYGYMGLNPADNSYQSMEPMTAYDRPLSVEGAMETSKDALENSHRHNSNPMGFGRDEK